MTSTYTDDRKRKLSLGVIAILVLAIGFAIGRLSTSESVVPPVQPGPLGTASEPGVGPRSLSSGVPVGYSRSEEGAVQAALAYLRALSPEPGETEERYAGKLRAIASSQWEGLDSTIASWDDGEAEVAPLRFRVTEFSDERAEVALWVAGFINPRDGAPGAVWGRALLTMVWENGDWKLSAEDADPGPWPNPLAPPSSPDELSSQLTDFRSIENEPAALP